jgi:hypothetical protein
MSDLRSTEIKSVLPEGNEETSDDACRKDRAA